MSQHTSNTTLSKSARWLCYLGPPSIILLTAFVSPKAALLTPIIFIPPAISYRLWRNSNQADPSRHGDLETIVWIFATVGTVGIACVAGAQAILLLGVSRLLFGSGQENDNLWAEFQRGTNAGLSTEQLIIRNELARSWQNWAFNAAISFLAAGLLEELLKLAPILYVRRYKPLPHTQQQKKSDRLYLDYAMAGGLSFGLLENIGFVVTAATVGEKPWSKLLLTLVERVAVGAPAHLLTASLTAIRAIRKDHHGEQLSWWSIVMPSVALHGVFDFAALSFSALEGNVGWVHPTQKRKVMAMFGLLAGVLGTAVWQVRRHWRMITRYDTKTR